MYNIPSGHSFTCFHLSFSVCSHAELNLWRCANVSPALWAGVWLSAYSPRRQPFSSDHERIGRAFPGMYRLCAVCRRRASVFNLRSDRRVEEQNSELLINTGVNRLWSDAVIKQHAITKCNWGLRVSFMFAAPPHQKSHEDLANKAVGT